MADDELPSDSSLLVIVVDTNPNQRYITEDPKVLTNCLDAVIAFANTHLMQKSRNQLAVIGCHFHKSEYLYPSPVKPLDVRQIDGQYELFTLVEKTIKTRLVNLIKTQPPEEKPGESLLAGALAMALCFIARMRRQAAPGLRVSGRILVVTGSTDTAAQYINYMNVFFTAQKQQVLIDVCSLDKHLSLLQQGCDITGGLYLKVPSLEGLLQYLLWVFLPEGSERTKLVLPGRGRVDYRAACFCHRELLTIGYVCSVCLSEQLQSFLPALLCRAAFRTGGRCFLQIQPHMHNLPYRVQNWRTFAHQTQEEENENMILMRQVFLRLCKYI